MRLGQEFLDHNRSDGAAVQLMMMQAYLEQQPPDSRKAFDLLKPLAEKCAESPLDEIAVD